jgi:ElaB/YqjD/DUF883 family membrane-anchored ribosome-binding protein
MTAAQKVDYTLDEMEAKYHSITGLYELADELLATVESPFVKDAEAQMNLVEPIINEISDAVDVLAEEFIHVADSRRGANIKANKSRVENALRKVFNALNDYQERVQAGSKKAVGGLKNIADPIIQKIHRHVEEVVVIFLEFIHLSLASIMHKQQLEAVRIRDPRIALMMHQQSLSQQ